MPAPIDFSKTLEEDVSLILVDATTYQSVIVKILKELIGKKKMNGIYIALNKPYKTLTKFLNGKGVDSQKLSFIDTLTEGDEKNKVYVQAENLSGMGIKIAQIMKKENPGFIIFDTVDTFMVYNKKSSLEKFFTSLITKLRNSEKKCIMIGIKEALLEHMLHISMERLSDQTVDLVPSPSDRFDKTFLKL
jgi:archaellum biogenesis ATPase FlaH